MSSSSFLQTEHHSSFNMQQMIREEVAGMAPSKRFLAHHVELGCQLHQNSPWEIRHATSVQWWEFKLHRITCWQLSMHLTAKFNPLPWFVLWEAISALLWYPTICFPGAWWSENERSMNSSLVSQNSVQSGVCECVCRESSQREERMLTQKMQTHLYIYIYIAHYTL